MDLALDDCRVGEELCPDLQDEMAAAERVLPVLLVERLVVPVERAEYEPPERVDRARVELVGGNRPQSRFSPGRSGHQPGLSSTHRSSRMIGVTVPSRPIPSTFTSAPPMTTSVWIGDRFSPTPSRSSSSISREPGSTSSKPRPQAICEFAFSSN